MKATKLLPFLFLALFAVSFNDVSVLGRFFIDEPFYAGSAGYAYLNVRNPTSVDIEDANVKIYIYDLGLRYVSNSFDVEDRDSGFVMMDMPIPRYTRPGDYLAKISVSNEDFRDTQHVMIRIV
tara:strand:+ start:1322 stop:1690 length:369 start_codon:yes stop_codon:yes gene_type:complete